MVDLLRTMAILSNFVTSSQDVFRRARSILRGMTASAVKALSSTISHYNITLMDRFENGSPLGLLDLWPFHLRCDGCQQVNYTNLTFAFLTTAIALVGFICINNVMSYVPDPQVRPETTRLHALERAITRQIEINYHLSRPSQRLSVAEPTSKSDVFEPEAAHWSDIIRFYDQAETNFKHGVPDWYYDEDPDLANRRHALEKELARLHSLGRDIVNAREDGIRYCENAEEKRESTAIKNEGLTRHKQINEMGVWKRSGVWKVKNLQGKATFQQQVDAVGRLTPGGRIP